MEEELLVVAAVGSSTSGAGAGTGQLEDRPEEEEGRVAGIAQLLEGPEEGGLALALAGSSGSEEGAELGSGANAGISHVMFYQMFYDSILFHPLPALSLTWGGTCSRGCHLLLAGFALSCWH